MLNPQIATERLKEFATATPREAQCARIAGLPEASRVAALALLGLQPDGTPFVSPRAIQEWVSSRKREAALAQAQEAAYREVDALLPAAREAFFAVYFPRLAPVLAAWWQSYRVGATLYQSGYNRRPFRLQSRAAGSVPSREALRERSTVFRYLIDTMRVYQEMPIDWFAAWAPYLGAHSAAMDGLGKVFAAAIDRGGADGEAVFEILRASGRGEHEIGVMGRHVVRGLLQASRVDGWEFIEKLLLAAQRQEGLHQSILEAADEAHPEAFRRLLRVIRENHLFRFSATIRAADVWFGMNWVAFEKLSVKQAEAATEVVETFLADPAGRDTVLATTTDGEMVYLALWSLAFSDARAALKAALPLLADPRIERRYAALYLLCELRLEETRPAIYAAFDDPDLRMAQKAFQAINWGNGRTVVSIDEELEDTLVEQEVGLTDLLETVAGPGTGLASFFGGIKDAISEAVVTLRNEKKVEDTGSAKAVTAVAPESRDVRFEALERNIPRFPAKPRVLEPVIWEWDRQTACAENLADRLTNALRTRATTRLFPYMHMMSSYGRAQVAQRIGRQDDKTEALRKGLFDLLSDSSSYVRQAAFNALETFPIVEGDAVRVEGLLTRKSADLRKSVLSLLLRQSDPLVLESSARLTGSRDANQRLAGLVLLAQMVDKERSPESAREMAARFAATRGDKLTGGEALLLVSLAASDEGGEKPTRENALGLMDDSKRTVAPAPVARDRFVYATDTAHAIVTALNAFVEQHKETPIALKNYRDDVTETLLGNMTHAAQLPSPDYSLSREDDLKRLSLSPELAAWWESLPAAMHDADGLELIRAQVACRARRKEYYGSKPNEAAQGAIEAFYSQIPAVQVVTPSLIDWLVRLYGVPSQAATIDFYLDATESLLAHVEKETPRQDWQKNNLALVCLRAARTHRQQNPEVWTNAQITRLWHLLCWLDQSSPASGRYRLAESSEIAAAFRIGAATEHDLYDHLLVAPRGPHQKNYRYPELQALSSRKSQPLFEKTPGLRAVVETCRQRILELELRRGDLETVASEPARALRYSGGRETLLPLVVALGKDTFARGYSYYGQTNRSNVFSHLIRATYPGEADTPEVFVAEVKAAGIGEKRLIETAVYAPQWARHVGAALGWEAFASGVWWLHAHTKDTSWSVEAEIKQTWAAEIADKTPLSAADLTDGAVDIAWFQRVYQALGEERWAKLSEAAQYASSSGGHKRAQLFADAMLGRLDTADLQERILKKRHQDSLRALGLLPLPAPDREPDAFAAELLQRYKTLQEFLRTSKQFGAQRQESEKQATRIGMENLARTAGYADPVRLTWAMEAAAVDDLKEGAVTKTVGDVSVALAINALGNPELTVLKKARALANVPPAVKKDPEVAALIARKTEITRQVSRMRESLEEEMCRGDLFTGAELAALLEHPILRPLLGSLVFIEAEGNEPVLGYPVGENHLEDGAGTRYALNAATRVRIAHPYDLLHTGRWEQWQRDCFLRERVQPFKQVFRELYVLTDAEKADATKSLRYSGHQVNPKQAVALFHKRGWVGGGEYDYESDGPRKTFHADDYTVAVGFQGWTLSPADVEGSTIESVRFTRKGDGTTVPLESVPPRVFSEAMRDLDLVVSVAHVGGVDPEASQSTVEMRIALLREAMRLLKIENVRFQKSHAIIEGALATYNVHLGSAIVHRQPGGYLCIVPVHSQHRGRLFLPFVDTDPRTAEVLSKVLLLARDREIKDPTILEQILSVG